MLGRAGERKSVYGKDRIASTIFITSSCYKWSRWAKVSLQLLLGGVLPLWHLINLLFNMLTTQGTTALSLALPSLTHPSATLTAPRINRWHCLTIATIITNWLSGVTYYLSPFVKFKWLGKCPRFNQVLSKANVQRKFVICHYVVKSLRNVKLRIGWKLKSKLYQL